MSRLCLLVGAELANRHAMSSEMAAPTASLTPAQRGVIYCVIAHLFWGTMALYFGFIRHIPAIEIAINRGLWSLPIAAVVIWYLGQWRDVAEALRNPKTFFLLLFTGSIILFNWGFYVWSIEVGRTLESSFGYFINPLLNVVAGFLFLGERFTRSQLLAIGLAAIAVLIQTFASGVFPWLGLMLGASFCLYGLLRKLVPVGPTQGFFIEILLLAVPLLLLELWFASKGQAKFGGETFDTLMLMGCGILTSGALIFFAASLKLIRYSTAGILQYISPSLVFLTAVFVFQEPMDKWKWLSFALIWLALAIYSWSSLAGERKPAREAAPEPMQV
jgi:chloramphenicol-sensitive protein RarD